MTHQLQDQVCGAAKAGQAEGLAVLNPAQCQRPVADTPGT